MGGEVLLFNRQINNKLSKTFFTFSLYFVFAALAALRRVSSPDAKIDTISLIKELRSSCARLFYFFNIEPSLNLVGTAVARF